MQPPMSRKAPPETFEHTGPAVLINHAAVFGRHETPVGWIKAHPPERYAQYPVTVLVQYREVRQPRQGQGYEFSLRVYPDHRRYYTIEVDGREVWDSRAVVPCDMDKWEETFQRFGPMRQERARESNVADGWLDLR
jgi:hypothetical protein